MSAPADWSTYHARAAADEIARGNPAVARVLLRDARVAAHRAKLISYKNHNGGNAR